MNNSGVCSGFVRVSSKNPQYFETENEDCFIPIGLNICWPRLIDPDDEEACFYEYDKQMKALAENGGNYIRLWLSADFFDVEHSILGQYDNKKFARIKKILKNATDLGIKVKLTIEHFRDLNECKQVELFPGSANFNKQQLHKNNGGIASNMNEFFGMEESKTQFRKKIQWFAEQVGDDPAVFAWELWNEIDSVSAEENKWLSWTRDMLGELHKAFPKNMACYNLGSFGCLSKHHHYHVMCETGGNDFNQAHRYLDPGAELSVCHGPFDVLCSDTIRELRDKSNIKPALLSEIGAVEWLHSAPSHLYKIDSHGMLLHDALFAPFFAGSAGTGQFWHWKFYVTENDLWWHFKRFKRAIENIDPIQESFSAHVYESKYLRLYVLRGKNVSIMWCRDKANTWKTELGDGIPPQVWDSIELDLRGVITHDISKAEAYTPWDDLEHELTCDNKITKIPKFERSIVLRFYV